MELASLILTIIFGVAGIIVSIYCWRHNYEKQKEHNKIIQELNALQLNKESAFSDLMQILLKAKDQNIDISKYFNIRETDVPEGKITRNQVLSAIYNMVMNEADKVKKNATNR